MFHKINSAIVGSTLGIAGILLCTAPASAVNGDAKGTTERMHRTGRNGRLVMQRHTWRRNGDRTLAMVPVRGKGKEITTPFDANAVAGLHIVLQATGPGKRAKVEKEATYTRAAGQFGEHLVITDGLTNEFGPTVWRMETWRTDKATVQGFRLVGENARARIPPIEGQIDRAAVTWSRKRRGGGFYPPQPFRHELNAITDAEGGAIDQNPAIVRFVVAELARQHTVQRRRN